MKSMRSIRSVTNSIRLASFPQRTILVAKCFQSEKANSAFKQREDDMFLIGGENPLKILGIEENHRTISIKKVHAQFKARSAMCDPGTREGQRQLIRLQRAHELLTDRTSKYYDYNRMMGDKIRQKLFLQMMNPSHRRMVYFLNVLCMMVAALFAWLYLFGVLRPAFKLREKRKDL